MRIQGACVVTFGLAYASAVAHSLMASGATGQGASHARVTRAVLGSSGSPEYALTAPQYGEGDGCTRDRVARASMHISSLDLAHILSPTLATLSQRQSKLLGYAVCAS
eukprot:scaffold88705_cov27-Tisochrysis_lutea.AAC.1